MRDYDSLAITLSAGIYGLLSVVPCRQFIANKWLIAIDKFVWLVFG